MTGYPDDIDTWPEQRLVSEIQGKLPEGTVLHYGWDSLRRCWVVEFHRETEEGFEVEWATTHVDPRMALYEAWGRLWLARRPNPRSVWAVPDRRPTRTSVAQDAARLVKDPEDLDPEEVRSVYEKHSGSN